MAEKKEETKVKNVEVMGVKLVVDPDVFDDWELLEKLGKAEENPLKMPGILRDIIGTKQYDLVMDSLRNKAGKVPATKAEAFIVKLMEAIAPQS